MNNSLQYIKWCDPFSLAHFLANEQFANQPIVFLHSSIQSSYSGRFSLLACNLKEKLEFDKFSSLESILKSNQEKFSNFWFGYLSYEMRHDCEDYTKSPSGTFNVPSGILMNFSNIFVFDHEEKTLALCSDEESAINYSEAIKNQQPNNHQELPKISFISSNMTRSEYEEKVATIINEIKAGNLYQANLTRKFYGEFDSNPRGIDIFAKLCEVSPAPYSAYFRFSDIEIISSSPELFLRVENSLENNSENNHAKNERLVTTRPIKGTMPRGKNSVEDEKNKQTLKNSEKNKAENLMITDLMRNDLSRVCSEVNVKDEDLFEITTHSNVFHMASTVRGKLKDNIPELLKATFPPGSMTGAPKIRAVELCNKLEEVERGIYSGALGWFGGDGSAELSVIIRTLLLKGKKFEFQVGGGIVADSIPEEEWKETIDKAIGIANSLKIKRSDLEDI